MDAVIHVSRFTVHSADLIAVLGLIPIGILAYALVLWLLRIEGGEELQALLRRRRTLNKK